MTPLRTGKKFDYERLKHQAAQVLFVIVMFQFPIFSVNCRKGICTSPLEIVASEVILTADPYGSHVARALLFPGALVADVTERFLPTEGQPPPRSFIPNWDGLLDRYGYKGLNVTDPDLNNRIELNAGANLVVFGSILGLVISNKMTVMGAAMMSYFFYKQKVRLPRDGEELSPDKTYIFFLFVPFIALCLIPAFDAFAKLPEVQEPVTLAKVKEEERKAESPAAVRSKSGRKDLKTIKRK